MIEAIIKDFQREKDRLKEVLASGHIDDHLQYKYIDGSIASLEWTIIRIKEIEARLMEEDEEEDF